MPPHTTRNTQNRQRNPDYQSALTPPQSASYPVATKGFSQTQEPTAQEILASVRSVTGGGNWNRLSECKSEGKFRVAGYTGTYRAVANLQTGETV